MDKNAIKKYAVWARRELIERVSQRALVYGITAENTGDPNAESVNGHLLSQSEKRQRQALIRNIKAKGYEQVMEEVAYTWFNRFAALRFMEVNGYLPSHIRVFTNDAGEFKPQILAEAIHLELEGLDMNKVYELESANKSEELFKYLLIVQCNALNSILPGMFQRIEDYTELLLPDYLLREGSVIEQMVTTIPEEDWTDQVQIIGWLYQYYNTEPKAEVFGRKTETKIKKEEIPAATQLFTPDWIVRYMVENSLGRLWLEGHPNEDLKAKWKFFLDGARQGDNVQKQLSGIRKEYAALKPQDILTIDPCQGSGHILAYMFDVLVQIYEAYGYSARESAALIVKNNLWGLDIDERAAQLAYFSVMMKARQYDRRFFSRAIQPNIYAIPESNNLDPHCIEYFVNNNDELKAAINTLICEMRDAKEYGSILNISQVDFGALFARFKDIQNEAMPDIYSYQALDSLFPFVQTAFAMSQKYHVVVTNPPYMGNAGFSPKLTEHAKKWYPDSKNDLYSIMMERCAVMVKPDYFVSMITMQSWINAPTFKNLRKKLFSTLSFVSINNMGSRAFDEIQGEKVKNVVFVIRNMQQPDYIPKFVDLTSISGEAEKRDLYLQHEQEYEYSKQSDFLKHDLCLVVYKTRHVKDIYSPEVKISDVSEVRRCIATGNDDQFIRLWFEVDANAISPISVYDSSAKWFFISDGGERRRWYGNILSILNWKNEGADLRSFNDQTGKSTLRNVQYMFREGLSYTYTSMGSGIFNARTIHSGMGSIGVGPVLVDNKDLIQMFALVNSAVFRWFWDTMYGKVSTFETGNVGRIAYKEGERDVLAPAVQLCIRAAKEDWDSFEVSRDFLRHPLMGGESIKEAFAVWTDTCKRRINDTRAAEEKMNRHLIEIYDLADEIDGDVKTSDVTIRDSDLQRDIRSLISYAVGCMFGRYSLDTPGLAYAGGPWDENKYLSFIPDKDAIIPICDDEYFEDDIVGRFVKFIEAAFGKGTLEENLRFIADALGGKGSSRDVIRNYFINDFYADHLKVYQKRPIYWLFDSGKKNGFKCLIYMHRYQPDTIARIRTDYVHEQQSRYRTAIADLEQRISGASTSERVKLSKQLATLQAQADEIRVYEEKIHHLADQMIKIDLDDGVKHNYEIFKDVLAKIK